MRFAILGSGAVGGYYGAKLARAGHDVTFIARGAHLAAIREHGLQIRSPMLGDFTVERCPVTTRFVVGEDELPVILSRLADTEAEVLSIVAVPTPDG